MIMKKLIAIISVMAALTAAVTSCEKDVIVGTNDGDGLYLNKVELTLVKGNSETLVATVTPKGAASLTWDSADDAVATVDSKGLVQAVGAGETKITASAGGMTIECLVKVQQLVTSLTLDKTEVLIAKGEETEVKATVGPADINVPYAYTWISSDESIFTVTPDTEDPSKAVVYGKKGGFGTLYAQAGDVITSIPVTIDVDLAGLVIKGAPTGKVYVGETFQLSVEKDPIDAIDEISPVWSSSDKSVVIVDQNGFVTTVGAGTATIKVETNGFEATLDVTINVLATVSFYPNYRDYYPNDSLEFHSSFTPGSSYSYVRSGDLMKFQVDEGLLISEIKIETYGGGSYALDATADSGSYNASTFTWTGNANSVTITVTSSYSYITRFTVTYRD